MRTATTGILSGTLTLMFAMHGAGCATSAADGGDDNDAAGDAGDAGGGPSYKPPTLETASLVPSTTDYPWAGLTINNGGDQWGMGYGQCVSYVAWMIYKNEGGTQHPPRIPDQGWFPTDGLAKGPVRASWGDAGDWNATAASQFRVDGTPHAGAVAQWVRGSDSGQFTVGHVAYVTAVNSDGSIDLAQYNLREDSKFSTLHMGRGGATDTSNNHGAFFVPWPDHFIHIGDGSIGGPAPRVFQVTGVDASGLAIQTQPHVGHVLRFAANGTSLTVSCQTKNGDAVDNRTQYGRPFKTWDQLSDGTWVYDWYMNTPTVATDGYSPGIPHCAGG